MKKEDSMEKIVYIRVTPTLTLQSGDTISVVSTKTGFEQSYTITLEAVCEPKYQQLQVIFYNKFGAMQIMPFFKKSTIPYLSHLSKLLKLEWLQIS